MQLSKKIIVFPSTVLLLCFIFTEMRVDAASSFIVQNEQQQDVRNQAQKDFFCAIKNNNLAEAKALLSTYNIDIDATGSKGNTVLHYASYKGNSSLVSFLLHCGANPNKKDSEDRTPLHYAAENGDTKTLAWLIEHGGDVRAQKQVLKENVFHIKANVFHTAVMHNNIAAVKFLLKRDPTLLESVDSNQQTALNIAADRGYSRLVKIFIAALKEEELLKSGDVDIDATGSHGNTVLHYASYKGNSSLVSFLLQRGANPNKKGNGGRTPLHYAAENGDTKTLALLRRYGGNVHAQKHLFKENVFHTAVMHNNIAAVKFLLKRDRTLLESVDSGQQTALNMAADRGYLDMVRLLIAAKAKLKGGNDFTPLHNAVFMGHVEIVRFLLHKGARLKCRTNAGETPLDIAVWRKESAGVFNNSNILLNEDAFYRFSAIEKVLKVEAARRKEERLWKLAFDRIT